LETFKVAVVFTRYSEQTPSLKNAYFIVINALICICTYISQSNVLEILCNWCQGPM